MPTTISNKSKLFLRRSLCINIDKRMSVKELFKFKESYAKNEILELNEKVLHSQPIGNHKENEDKKREDFLSSIKKV